MPGLYYGLSFVYGIATKLWGERDMKRLLIVFQIVAVVVLGAQDIIDVGVRGISDARRDGVQKDRLEAIMDAKRPACEQAGITIESTTPVENLQMGYDLGGSQRAAVWRAGGAASRPWARVSAEGARSRGGLSPVPARMCPPIAAASMLIRRSVSPAGSPRKTVVNQRHSTPSGRESRYISSPRASGRGPRGASSKKIFRCR